MLFGFIMFVIGGLMGVAIMCLMQISSAADDRIESQPFEKK